ncbi:PAP2 superfamily protein [Orenia metallireducens]|nr:PAP2 superfamily protein [Orenia metallireducens]
MLAPSIYMYILFIFIIYYLIKEDYWKGSFSKLQIIIKKNSNLFLIALILTIFSISFLDLPISKYFSQQNSISFLKPFIKIINNFGDGSFIFPLFTTLLIVSLLIQQDKYKKILLISLSSSIYAGLFNLFLKIFFNRARPYIDLNPYKLFVYKNINIFRADYWSMPSGHTIVAFAAIIPLVIHFENKLLKSLLITISILEAFARVYLFKHWLSDVIMAAFLGTIIGIIAYQNNITSSTNKELIQ